MDELCICSNFDQIIQGPIEIALVKHLTLVFCLVNLVVLYTFGSITLYLFKECVVDYFNMY